jgi:DNA-binding beta-propeller fold protein YncE
MTGDIRKLMHASPFVPFTIHTADGGQLRVPTVDHVAISPAGGRVIVFADDDTHDVVSGLLISRVTVDRQPTPRGQAT